MPSHIEQLNHQLMALKKGFEPHHAIGETTVTGRDIEMLRSIDQFGSMHKVAAELGRSYPRLQRRVVELEEAIGQLPKRIRGGKNGGGTELTSEVLDLIQQATVRTAAGDISARFPMTAEDVEIAVRADAGGPNRSRPIPDRACGTA